MLQVQDISVTFNPGTEAEMVLYQGLNILINEGEFVTIIGSNGSGKSTLLNMVCGQVKPDLGIISFEGENILNKKDYKRFSNISRVYQDPMSGTSPTLTVAENLSLALNKRKLFNFKKALNKADYLMFAEKLKTLNMGLENKLDVKVGQLSGGQRQALSLLMSLMNNPKLLLLDEHTAALDPKSSEAIMALTDKLVKESNITTVMVTHNLQHALDYGDRLLMFHGGKIIVDIKKNEKKKLVRQDLVDLFRLHDDYFIEAI